MRRIGQTLSLLAYVLIGATQAQDFEVVSMGKAATALVECVKDESTATAFCIDARGLFVTNHHVVKDVDIGDELNLVMNIGSDKERIVSCTVLRSNEEFDLALLKSTTPGNFPFLQLGSDDEVFETLPTIAFGFPFGKDLSVEKGAYPAMSINTGRITSIRQKRSEVDLFQVDTQLNPGNSGGPVLNADGKVIGVVNRGVMLTGINFAVPIGKLKRLIATPDVKINLPKDIATDASSPKTLTVEVKPIARPFKELSLDISVEMAGQEPRNIAVKSTETGAFSGEFVPVPHERQEVVIVETDATYPSGHVVGKTTDIEFKLDLESVWLSKVSQITSEEDGEYQLDLITGGKASGKIEGLNDVEIDFGTTKSNVDLSKASTVKLWSRKRKLEATYTIIVRDEGKEIFRKVVRSVSATLPGLVARHAGEVKSIPIPGKASDVVLAGAGTQMLVVMAASKRLMVLDLVRGEVRKFLPLGSHDVLVAGTRSHIIVLDRSNDVLERWSLKKLTKERVVKPPFQGIAKSLITGNVTEGPVIALWAQGSDALSRCQFMSIDVATLQGNRLEAKGGRLHVSFRDATHLRMSADGSVFGMWATSHSPQGLNSVRVQGNQLIGLNKHTSVGHVVPGPSGMHLFTGLGGVFTNELNAKSANSRSNIPCVPTSHSNFYVTVPAEPGAQRNMGRNPFKGIRSSLNVVSSQSVLTDLPDLGLGSDDSNRSWTTSDFSLDKRVHFHVQAGLLATVPFTNDKVLLQKVDLEETLRKSGTDYFFIMSVPERTFVAGQRYEYQCSVLARRDGVRFELASGPEGMEVSRDGKLTWDVPSGFTEDSVNVILNVEGSEGESLYDTFTLRHASSD